jgi:hypothetical protein
MAFVYNKLCNKQDAIFLVGYICTRDKDHQNVNLKKHTNHLISSSHV